MEAHPLSRSTSLIGVSTDSSSSSSDSLEAPVYSPISGHSGSDSLSSCSTDGLIEQGEVVSDSEGNVDEEEQVNGSGEGTESGAVEQELSRNCGYKIVGDNIDKNVKPSLQRAEIKAQSLHYFHSYAVKDRVPVGGLSDNSPVAVVPDVTKFLPSLEEIELIKEDMHALLSR